MKPTAYLRFRVQFPSEHSPLSEKPQKILQQKWESDTVGVGGVLEEWRDVELYIPNVDRG